MNRHKASDAEIAQVDLEILELQKQLQNIGIALQIAQERRADFVIYTAPIHSLHKEILLEIFQIVVDSEFHSPPQLHFAGSPALLLSQIARRWRYVVASTPSLWAHSKFLLGHLWTLSPPICRGPKTCPFVLVWLNLKPSFSSGGSGKLSYPLYYHYWHLDVNI
jgi:hypothetical protein